MGLAHATVTVRGLNGGEGSYTGNFLVDSGATDSLVSRGELESIGITPEDTVVYELANGTKHSYEIGFARFTVQGATRVGSVIFGPQGVEPILGVTILESAGLMIDPITQTLKKLPAVPLKSLVVRIRILRGQDGHLSRPYPCLSHSVSPGCPAT